MANVTGGRLLWIVALACLWIYLAYSAYSRGQTNLALIYLAAGVVLTIWRLRRS